MLVLSRRVGQQIRIGKSVVVTLLKVERNKARIGVEAPPNIPVYRQELLRFDEARPEVGSCASAEEPTSLPKALRLGGPARRRWLWEDVAG